MGRRFRADEWLQLRAGLQRAEQALATYRAQPREARDRELLESALRDLWKFAEYTINALRELSGQDPDHWHEMGKSARDLLSCDVLSGDYSHRLDQLEKYRLKSDYCSYSRERSVNLPTVGNLADCVESLRGLESEAKVQLRQGGFL